MRSSFSTVPVPSSICAALLFILLFGSGHISLALGASVNGKRAVGQVGRPVSDIQCRPWFNVASALEEQIFGNEGCGQQARSAIRLTFHDSVGLSRNLTQSGQFGGGGADGSIILFANVELADPANTGLQEFVSGLKAVADAHQVSYGDIIQLAGAIALTKCPGAPRLAFLAGRAQARAAAPPSLTPAPYDSVEKILGRMDDAGFTADDTVALLAAHSVGAQHVVDPSRNGQTFDSTPAAFDSAFYDETLYTAQNDTSISSLEPGEAACPVASQFRLQSDAAIARAPQTACKWQSFADSQTIMSQAFRDAMYKVATNGQDVTALVDCSEVVPQVLSLDGTPRRAEAYALDRPCPASAA